MALMKAPETGAAIRMYRQGHGDCFLLAFPREGGGRAVYMLIDCGYKPGSQITRKNKKVDATRVVGDIAKATGKKIDIVVITHEHQDHVNALGKFKDFEFKEAWFAWTEDPKDDDAKELRRRHKDQLLGLMKARNTLKLALADAPDKQESLLAIDELLALEIGNDQESAEQSDDEVLSAVSYQSMFGTASDPLNSANKKAMSLIKERAGNRLRFISPHGATLAIGQAAGVRAYALGPPRDANLLSDEDPKGAEGFPGHNLDSSLSFYAAARSTRDNGAWEDGHPADNKKVTLPFSPAFSITKPDDLPIVGENADFFARYLEAPDITITDDDAESPDNASWRLIDNEWLHSAESFALKMNRGINNTSLVLAIELQNTGKVLLFGGDAQRGSWRSWNNDTFDVDGSTVTVRELLANTVVYKACHHGSHNATLNGTEEDEYPNLAWMGQGNYASEFTTFITAHNDWAVNTAKWNHPLPSIKQALLEKSGGRVFQTDEDSPQKPDNVPQADWDSFLKDQNVKCTDLYFEITVQD